MSMFQNAGHARHWASREVRNGIDRSVRTWIGGCSEKCVAWSRIILGTICQEVVAPDVVCVFRLVAHTTVGASPRQTTPFPLLFRYLQMFLLPEAMDPLEIDAQACPNEKLMDTLAPVTGPRLHQPPHLSEKMTIHIRAFGTIPLRTPRLA